MATMASTERSLSLITALVIAATWASIVEAQAPAPPQLTATTTRTHVTCRDTFVALLPCANYIMGSNGTATPACCNAFAAVVFNNAETCLCQFLGTQNPLGFLVNQTQVLALPKACNVAIPFLPIHCSAIRVPLMPNKPVTPTSPGSSHVPIASAPTPLSSPLPSTTAAPLISLPEPPITMPDLSPLGSPRPSTTVGPVISSPEPPITIPDPPLVSSPVPCTTVAPLVSLPEPPITMPDLPPVGSPRPSTTAAPLISSPEPPITMPAPPPLGSPAGILFNGDNFIRSSSNVGSSQPISNSGASVSTIFRQPTVRLTVGVILASFLI